METLPTRITAPGLRKMDVSNLVTTDRTCDKHGPFRAIVLRGREAGCPTCMDESMRIADETREMERAAERRRSRSDYLLGRSAIPLRFSDRRLSTFIPHAEGPQRALAVATEYASNFDDRLRTGASLIFCGGVGAGKTHLAVGIAHEIMANNRMALFTSVIGAIRSVKETYSRDSALTEREAIDNLIEPDLLILDEVGIQFGSETERLILFEIINGRYEALKPTLVISNLAKLDLERYLGERVMDRLREGGGRMVLFEWPSYRLSI